MGRSEEVPGLPGRRVSPSTDLTPAAGGSAPTDLHLQLQHYGGNDHGLKLSRGKWRHKAPQLKLQGSGDTQSRPWVGIKCDMI
jgi:hypothetical protein